MKNLLILFLLFITAFACNKVGVPAPDTVSNEIEERAQNRMASWSWDESQDTFILRIIYAPACAPCSTRVSYSFFAAAYSTAWGPCEWLNDPDDPWYWSFYPCTMEGDYGVETRGHWQHQSYFPVQYIGECSPAPCEWDCAIPQIGCYVIIIHFQYWDGSNWVDDGYFWCDGTEGVPSACVQPQ